MDCLNRPDCHFIVRSFASYSFVRSIACKFSTTIDSALYPYSSNRWAKSFQRFWFFGFLVFLTAQKKTPKKPRKNCPEKTDSKNMDLKTSETEPISP